MNFKNLSNSALDSLDLSVDVENIKMAGAESRYYELPSGQEHYRLLRYISSQYHDATILDIGSYQGCSAVALNCNGNKIHSFDIRFNGTHKHLMQQYSNIIFRTDDILNAQYKNLILESAFIVLDTDHDGTFENEFVEYLNSIQYKNFIIFDDIYLNSEMRNFWNGLPDNKIDITQYGHITGTGVLSPS